MKLQLSYEIMFDYVQKLQMVHLIPLKTINIVSYNKFSEPRQGRFLGLTQTHQHNAPSLQQPLVFTHNNYVYLFSKHSSPFPNNITGAIVHLVAFHSFARVT